MLVIEKSKGRTAHTMDNILFRPEVVPKATPWKTKHPLHTESLVIWLSMPFSASSQVNTCCSSSTTAYGIKGQAQRFSVAPDIGHLASFLTLVKISSAGTDPIATGQQVAARRGRGGGQGGYLSRVINVACSESTVTGNYRRDVVEGQPAQQDL